MNALAATMVRQFVAMARNANRQSVRHAKARRPVTAEVWRTRSGLFMQYARNWSAKS